MCNPLWSVASEFLKRLSELNFEDYCSLIAECEPYECAIIAAGFIESLSCGYNISECQVKVIDSMLEVFGKRDMVKFQLMLVAFHKEVQAVFKTYINANYSRWRIGFP